MLIVDGYMTLSELLELNITVGKLHLNKWVLLNKRKYGESIHVLRWTKKKWEWNFWKHSVSATVKVQLPCFCEL